MNRHSQHGIALVITLIMLSVVTLMAVVFLAVSRREKASVAVSSEMTDARLMADAALERAQAEVLARIMGMTNPHNYDLMVSTNYMNPRGFQPGTSEPWNVNYTYPSRRSLNGPARGSDDLLQNLANLLYDPRPPVFFERPAVQGGLDFRYYLDFNRNGKFEATGYQPVGLNGKYILDSNGRPTERPAGTNYFVGDPQWIGILDRPDQPHSESNLFVGRYAFLVQPIGKSLDLNAIHNKAKFPNDRAATLEGFFRNQGVGSWEINLAGFLTALNPNVWGYGYRPNLGMQSLGSAFRNALDILRFRYTTLDAGNNRSVQLQSVLDTFGPRGEVVFQNDAIDGYSDGPYIPGPSRGNPDQVPPSDATRQPWAGAVNPQGYYDMQELFDTNKTSSDFVMRLLTPAVQRDTTSDRYTFYRLLAQMGVDSSPSESNSLLSSLARPVPTRRVNINYWNPHSGAQTNFISWWDTNKPVAVRNAAPAYRRDEPDFRGDFFRETADRLIRASLVTNVVADANGAPVETNLVLGGRIVPRDFGLTNLVVYTRGVPRPQDNGYFSEVHRLLQLTANVLDATTNIVFPSVFRPVFYKRSNGDVLITDYVLATNALFIDQFPWYSLEQVAGHAPGGPGVGEGLLPNINVFGIPVIIGAKKGFPNFNEFSVRNAIQVSRKLEIHKPSTNAPPPWQTNQMYVLGISNLFGIEAWNSYTQDYPNSLQLAGLTTNNSLFEVRMTNYYTMALSNVFTTNAATPLIWTNGIMSRTFLGSVWTNRTSVGSYETLARNVVFLPDSAYNSTYQVFTDPTSSNSFERVFRVPHWVYYVTNRVQYMMIDRSVDPLGKVVDFVNLDDLVTAVDISDHLVGDRSAPSSQIIGGTATGMRPGDFWIPDRAGNGVLAPTVGVTNQIGVASGNIEVGSSFWRSYNGNIVSGMDKDRAIDTFRVFLGERRLTAGRLPPPSAAIEVPFTPTRLITQQASWQANDPLVHYTPEDLSDPWLTDPNSAANVQTLAPRSILPELNLGRLNERYNPWGGRPLSSARDPRAVDMRLKDPGVRQTDDWEFPTNRFPNIGMLGRVHRGTPWQTVYLKSRPVELKDWAAWSGSAGHSPTNDWRLLDVFTVSMNDNAARGLLSVNQTNVAAWAGVLSGVGALTNTAPDGALQGGPGRQYEDVFVDPRTPHIYMIVDGIIRAKMQQPRRSFDYMGAVLATPELSDESPYLNRSPIQIQNGLTDAVVERIPQQILSLLRPDDPRVVVYAFGQSLAPAPNSLATSGNFYNICTNYQVTGEAILKAVVRIEPLIQTRNKWRTVVESFTVLPPE